MGDFSNKFSELCTPAKFYLISSIIFTVFGLIYSLNILIILFKLFFMFLWTLLLNYLCSVGLGSLSWFLVIIPYVLLFLSFFFILNINKNVLTAVATQVPQVSIFQHINPYGSEGSYASVSPMTTVPMTTMPMTTVPVNTYSLSYN